MSGVRVENLQAPDRGRSYRPAVHSRYVARRTGCIHCSNGAEDVSRAEGSPVAEQEERRKKTKAAAAAAAGNLVNVYNHAYAYVILKRPDRK